MAIHDRFQLLKIGRRHRQAFTVVASNLPYLSQNIGRHNEHFAVAQDIAIVPAGTNSLWAIPRASSRIKSLLKAHFVHCHFGEGYITFILELAEPMSVESHIVMRGPQRVRPTLRPRTRPSARAGAAAGFMGCGNAIAEQPAENSH
ncbi:MAG: hypothetical protein ACREEK_19600 [Bradyrhizobium sp.]